MVLREVFLHGIEQLLIGCPRERCPALALCDPLVAFDSGPAAVADRHLWMCPVEVVRVGPIHVRKDR